MQSCGSFVKESYMALRVFKNQNNWSNAQPTEWVCKMWDWVLFLKGRELKLQDSSPLFPIAKENICQYKNSTYQEWYAVWLFSEEM